MVKYGVAAMSALAALWLTAAPVEAKDKVKVGFIGPLTGGVSVNGLGGRNSADLAVKLRNADAKAKYEYELVVLDDACTPNVAVQVATKMSADKEIIAAATHYCSSTAIATVDVYHKFGLPVVVWGAVLPDITYRNKYAEVHRVNGTMINQNDANAELIATRPILAVKLRNADAKAKYEYELVVLDDACTPNVAVQVATKMSADKEIIAAATHYCSSTAIATVDVYHKFGLPVVVWGAVLPDITYRNKYAEIHRVNGTMINQNDANAELISKIGYKTVAVIHDTTDYGKGHNQYFSAALAKLGGKIVGTFGVTADQQDFTAELTQIKALNPEVIYFGGLTPIGVRIRSQMDKLGIKAVFDGTSGIVSDAFIQGLGPLAEGVLAFREGAPTEKLPGGKFFMDNYTAQKYDNPPEAYGAFAYAAMALILDSIEKVGPDRKKVIDEMAKVKDRDSIVGKITFDDHGQNTVPVITKYVIQDGKFVEWDDSEYASGKRKLPGQK